MLLSCGIELFRPVLRLGRRPALALPPARARDRGRRRLPARRLVDPPPVRPQPRRGRGLRLQPRGAGGRLDGTPLDAAPRGRGPGRARVAGVALLWAGPVAWGALAGMEVGLAALLVAAALLAHARDSTGGTALLAALAVLARPESAVLVPLLLLARPVTGGRAAIFVGVTLV